MRKQDRQGARTPADIERKYDYKGFARAAVSATEATKAANEGNKAANEANKRAAEAYAVASEAYRAVSELAATCDILDSQISYTAMMTETLVTTLTKDKISGWYAKSLWTDTMVEEAVDNGVITSDEAAEILG